MQSSAWYNQCFMPIIKKIQLCYALVLVSVDLPPKIDSNAVTFNENDCNKNLLELNAQDMKLCKENACFVIPGTSF